MTDYSEFIFVLVKINNSENSFFLSRSYPEHMVLYNVKEEEKLYLEHEIIHILKSICNSQRTRKGNKNSSVLKLFCL